MRNKNLLVFDMSTVFYRAFYVHNLNDHDKWAKIAHLTCLNIMNKFYKEHSPDRVIAVFDRDNWRKDYTLSEQCISKREYKGHRRQSMSPKQQADYKVFKEFATEFQNMLIETTGITCLYADKLEADDIIAGICRVYGGDDNTPNNKLVGYNPIDDHNVIVVSGDGDMTQLLRYQNVKLFHSKTYKEVTLDSQGFDSVDYYLYEKSMVGDTGDNIKSAYPKFWKKKIRAAFEDPYKHSNLMNAEWINENEQVMVVGELFKENRLLVDLSHQPDEIQKIMWDTIEQGMKTKKKYNMFKFVKYAGKNELQRVLDYLSAYESLLS